MNLNLWQQTNPTTGSNVLVMAIYKASAPSIVVAYYVLPGPYTGQTQLHTFTGLDNVVYHYNCFESPDGLADGTVRNSFDVQPGNNTYATRDLLYLIGNSSLYFASGTNFYGQDSSLPGWNWYLERVDQGTLQYGVDWTKTVAGVATTIDDTTADGWKLLASGDVVGIGEKFVIHFYPQLSATTTISSGSVISQTTLITSTISLDNTATGASFLIQGTGGYLQVNLPDLGTITDNIPIWFSSAGGVHVNVGFNCFGTQKILYYSNQSNLASNISSGIIYLGQNERLGIYSYTPASGPKVWIIFEGGDKLDLVGELISQYSKIPNNTTFASGALLSRSTYSRLWAYVQTLEPACVVTDVQWNGTTTVIDNVTYYLNKGKFSSGDGSTTFRVPQIYTPGFIRFVDGSTRNAGNLQFCAMLDHEHDTLLGSYPSQPNGKGLRTTVGAYNGIVTAPSDLTGKAGYLNGGTFALLTRVDTEVRTDNVGVYGLIRI